MMITLGIVALVVGVFIFIYNRLIALKQTRNNAFSDIDVQLKQRFDLIPSLIETVKGYATHEKQVFENVTQARAQAGAAKGATGERMAAETMLGGALMGLLAVAENYPALKADQNFQRLMGELSDIENKIAAARRFFNNTTAEYNTAIEQFPAVLIAGPFGFGKETFFEIPEAEAELVQKAPEVKF